MMNSEELEVLKVLYRHNNEEDATTEYSLTNRKFVKAISQTITDVIYDSYKNKSLSSRNTRQTFIELLKTWIEPNSHFLIDDSNYNIIVKSLIKEPSPAENFYNKHGKDFIQLCQKSSQINVKCNLDTISDTISKKYTSSLENKIKSDLIQTWQKSQFEKINFDFSLSNKNYQNSDVESLIEYLRNIQIKSSPIKKINQFTDKLESKQSFNNLESSIELGYALLNFEKSADNEKLLLKILEKIFCAKSEDGVKFVDHIWKNQDFSE